MALSPPSVKTTGDSFQEVNLQRASVFLTLDDSESNGGLFTTYILSLDH
jgi:hypothetical protein